MNIEKIVFTQIWDGNQPKIQQTLFCGPPFFFSFSHKYNYTVIQHKIIFGICLLYVRNYQMGLN